MHHISTQLPLDCDFGVLFERWIKQLMVKHNVKNDFVYANIVLIFSDFFCAFYRVGWGIRPTLYQSQGSSEEGVLNFSILSSLLYNIHNLEYTSFMFYIRSFMHFLFYQDIQVYLVHNIHVVLTC